MERLERMEQALQESVERIQRAKQEWESTVDALPQLVCLLDDQGRILRANRTVERWHLGRVDDVRGRDLHELFHPGCSDPDCYVKTCWPRAREEVVQGRPYECKVEDKVLNRYLEIQVCPISGTRDGGGKGSASFAVIAVGDITEQVRAERAARQVDRLRVLNELDRTLVVTLDPQKIAEVTLQQVAAALDVPMGALLVLSVQAHTHSGQVAVGKQRLFSLKRGWIEIAASESGTRRLRAFLRRLQDVREIAPFSGDELAEVSGHRDWAQRWGSNGILVPLRSDEGVIAAMVLGGRPEDRPFTQEDLALVQAAAGRAGQATQNAWLYQASQQQSKRLITLNAISAAAVSSLELDTILRRVLELTCQALNTSAGSIMVSAPDTRDLQIFALNLAEEKATLHDRRLAPGQGIAGWVADGGQAVRVNDVRHDPRWYDGIDAVTGFETRSLLCAPLRHRGRITGVIEVVSERPSAFTDDDLSLLEAVSSIAAAALENTRLYAATHAYAERMVLLHQTGRALTASLDYPKVIRTALAELERMFSAEGVSLLQPDAQTGELRFVHASVDGAPIEVPVNLQPGEGIAGWVLHHGQPVLVDDAQTDSRFSGRVDQYVGFQTRALMAVPLMTPERDIGVIEVISGKPGAYTRGELNTLQAIAATLAVALENARLYAELKTLLREREEARERLMLAEKMTALGRLTASIAHEINNPLQAMQTYLTLAQESLDDDQNRERMERYLNTVGDEIERIATIVQRMRDFYRPARPGVQATELDVVLKSVLELANKQLQHSHVVVECDWADGLPKVQANPDHLKQVFLNLVLNAIDAMPSGGTLNIHATLDQMQVDGGDSPLPAVRIEFSDTGEGMSQEVLSHLFEPFFTTKERGTGLGLSISYGIIKSHSGQIVAESHVGLGTTFTILLPERQLWERG